ncbi:MAG: P-loop NTPase [PVC group bacterium]|nr:P-loop NTPase [PVC group bacterium]
MKQIVVISGKGGTGKTVITAAFAALAKNACFADCDVDAADLHLLLNPKIKQKHDFKSGKTAKIDIDLCRRCNRCFGVCRFEAIKEDFTIDSINCEGCGICAYICPVKAITMQDNLSGEWFISETKYGPMVHAKLGIAEENSGKLVTLVKKQSKKIAEDFQKDYLIVDGPPGIGCPVIASLANVDIALIVTEPTYSGMHDMQRVIDLANHFGIKTKVIINKYDINLKNTKEIIKKCELQAVGVLGQLPFTKEVSQSLLKNMPIPEFTQHQITREISKIWKKIQISIHRQ